MFQWNEAREKKFNLIKNNDPKAIILITEELSDFLLGSGQVACTEDSSLNIHPSWKRRTNRFTGNGDQDAMHLGKPSVTGLHLLNCFVLLQTVQPLSRNFDESTGSD